ncbi:MAG: M48 family metalloprotease, partial [Planctomycetes bacterium]|nr:M48 family metalloprotease [Planctomycetota bacterium]
MPPSLTSDERDLIAALREPIAPVRTAVGYRIALMLVAVVMVILPLIYLAIVALACYGLYWHATENASVFSSMHGRHSGKGAFLTYVGPLVIGGILVLFLFKPLFAPRGKRNDPITLDPAKEPGLFAFVERLCTSMDAPVPRRIDVTCEVNASAGFRRGMTSMLGNDLVLTIGLPLAAGTSVRQLTGVLAHEFGHFAQGAAMRANYVVRTVNHWFARVVYQRDVLDEWLVRVTEAAGNLHIALAIVMQLARAMVWLSRRVLWVLMMIGQLVSSLMSRQMEFDADRSAVRVVGHEHFSSMLRELPVICLAERGALHDLRAAWREKRLGDDLPALIEANLRQVPAEMRESAVSDGMAGNTSMYDSHPPTRDRIAAAKAEGGKGIFAAEGPASRLFRDFPALCRRTTLAWYRESAGLEVTATNLVSTAELLAQSASDEQAQHARSRWFGGLWADVLLLQPGSRTESDTAPAVRLSAARTALEVCAPGAIAAHGEFAAAETAVVQPSIAAALISAGMTIDPREFGLSAA